MGKELRNQHGLTEKEFLAQYDAARFPRPSVTVDVLIFRAAGKFQDDITPHRELQALLIRRGDHPCIGQWALPGGFVNMDESLEQAAARELLEETGVSNVSLEQLYTAGNPKRDPRTRIISTIYLALVREGGLAVQAGDDAADAQWFRISEKILHERRVAGENGTTLEQLVGLQFSQRDIALSATVGLTWHYRGPVINLTRKTVSSQGVAFDHAMIIQTGLTHLKSKILHSALVFNLLPETFSLEELRQICSLILNRPVLENELLSQLGKFLTVAGTAPGKPADLYRFNPAGLII